jgi:MFS family permease
MIAFPLIGSLTLAMGWRTSWALIGGALFFVLTPLAAVFVRSRPSDIGVALDGGTPAAESAAVPEDEGATFGAALRTPAFWVFATSGAMYGLVASGIGLFNESILAERGFDPSIYHTTLAVTAISALAGNFGAGAWADRRSIRTVLVAAMLMLAGSLASLPFVATYAHVMLYAVVMGIAGGFVMVVFFSFWGRAYGRRHLGRIQGMAQIMTVVASAVGPLLLAICVRQTGSYAAAFFVLSAAVAVLAGLATWIEVPAGASRPLHR